jgi:hypothetical protein
LDDRHLLGAIETNEGDLEVGELRGRHVAPATPSIFRRMMISAKTENG